MNTVQSPEAARPPSDAASRQLVLQLAEAHRSGSRIDPDPSLVPDTLDDAYSLQAQIQAELGWSWAGWKSGAQAVGAPTRFGPFFAHQVVRSPARRPRGDFAFCGVEAEIAFILGEKAAVLGANSDRETIMGAVASVHYAIEVVDSRLARFPEVPPFAIVSDNQCSGLLVVGDEIPGWAGQDLAALRPQLEFDGGLLAPFVGNPGGAPLDALRLLAAHCHRHGLVLEAGMTVLTGSCTGLKRAPGRGLVTVVCDGRPRTELFLA